MTVGTHIVLTVRNLPNPSILETIEGVKPKLERIILKCDLHVVAEAGHQFEPVGATYVFVLSESHMSIHTYPELNTAYLDIFCCSSTFDPLYAVTTVSTEFETNDIDYKILTR
jgi:S-adenosylmethionine decarboxylase